MTRKQNKLSVINHDHAPKVFKFSICPTEHLEIVDDEGNSKIVRVLSISDGDIECIHHCDARPAGIRRKDGSRMRFSLSKLMRHKAKKIVISPLGGVFNAND